MSDNGIVGWAILGFLFIISRQLGTIIDLLERKNSN